MSQYTFHIDSQLAAAVRKVFGWSAEDHRPFTMIRTGQDGTEIVLVFDADCELRVRVQIQRHDLVALTWSADGPRPDDVQAANIGHALEQFFAQAGLLDGPPKVN